MADVKGMLKKIGKFFKQETSQVGEKLTSDEIELKTFKRREYLDNVKKELHKYRKKNSYLNGFNWNNELGEKEDTILKSKMVFKDEKVKHPDLLNSGNPLLNSKRLF